MTPNHQLGVTKCARCPRSLDSNGHRLQHCSMDLHTWLIYVMAAVGLSLSPGPNGLLALTHGALHGRRKAIFTVAGGCLGFVTMIGLSMFGIGALLQDFTRMAHRPEVGGWRLPRVAWNSSLAVIAHRC